MNFKTKIKLGNITNLSDARFAAAAGIDYIGFCFDKDRPDYIPPIKAKEIIDWITGSSIVGEFGNQTLDEINDIGELLGLEVIEVNNTLLPGELTELGKAIIKKIDISSFDMAGLKKEIEAYHIVADAFHLYSHDTKAVHYDSLLKELCGRYPIILGLILNKDNILSGIDYFKPYGINITGGDEEKTGIKDFDELNELLEKIAI